jgi:dihydrofolate reductase
MSEKQRVDIAMIVAMAENQVIGRNNQLPWHLPNDLKYFKATTLGKPVVMGRKTFESIGKPLPRRSNIVVTSNAAYSAEGVMVAHGVEQAIDMATNIALNDGVSEIMVIGGAQLYAELLPKADRLYLTLVHAKVDGDAYFPVLDKAEWSCVSREDFGGGSGDQSYEYSFTIVERSST